MHFACGRLDCDVLCVVSPFSCLDFCLFWWAFPYFQGRFNIAAKHHVAIAELYETQDANTEKVGGFCCVRACVL